MSDSSVQLSVVIPCYKEGENLQFLIPKLKATLDRLTPSYEILLIDTVTPMDNTPEFSKVEKVRYLNRQPDNKFGSAVRTGINAANGKYVVFMDADGSHAPEFIEKLYQNKDQYEIVIASRYIDGGSTENNFLLKFMSRVLNWTYALILNIKCKDVSNSFKLYRAEHLKSLKLKCDNFDIVEEILFKINRDFKVRILELPFLFEERKFGESKRNLFFFIITYISTLIKLRLS